MGHEMVVAAGGSAPAVVNWEAELRGVGYLLKSGFVPQSVRSSEQALFIVMTGRDLGLSPVQSLRSIQVIQGKVELAADLQLALFVKAGGRFKWLALDNTQARLWLAYMGNEATSTFTADDAKRAGLGGDNWRKYPRAMLRSRAITQGMKEVGFDGLAGVYAPGELSGAEEVTPGGEVVAATVVEVQTNEWPPHVDADGVVQDSAPEAHASGALIARQPFGKNKGKPVTDISDDDLKGAAEWAESKGKFSDYVSAARAELARRRAERAAQEVPDAADLNTYAAVPAALDDEDDRDDLPF